MWQISFILIGAFQLSDAVSLICYNGTIDNYQVATLDNAATLINSSCIDVCRQTLIYVFGYEGEVNGNSTRSMINACLEDSIKRNCVLLNWEKEASANILLGIESTAVAYVVKAVPNSINIGKKMGKVLLNLTNYGLNLTRVMLMGHSLGAHLWGHAGREVNDNGKEIGIIAGLDPAGPLYNTPILEPLDSTSGKFVYCVHTDPGFYGTTSSVCTVDIWVNPDHFIGGDNLQPGCTSRMCNHDRVILLLKYAMLENKTSLEASLATDYSAWVAANGTSVETIYIGDLINTEATPGKYYLTTNAPPDFGKGKEGLRP